jgi:hypothetical protein
MQCRAWICLKVVKSELLAGSRQIATISPAPQHRRNGSFPCVGRVKYPILRRPAFFLT